MGEISLQYTFTQEYIIFLIDIEDITPRARTMTPANRDTIVHECPKLSGLSTEGTRGKLSAVGRQAAARKRCSNDAPLCASCD